MFIEKYKLTSKFSEENEFETTKTRKTYTEFSMTSKTDDEGNQLKQNIPTPPVHKQYHVEEITAVSLPSRTPAKVEILETIDDNPPVENQNIPKEFKPKDGGPKVMQGPVRQRPITLDQLQGNRAEAKPIWIKTDPENINWV